MLYRPRRNRKNSAIRGLVQETYLHASDLIYPLFIIEGSSRREPISSMPGIYRLGIDAALQEIDKCLKLGIASFALFPVIAKEKKTEQGLESLNEEGLLQKTIQRIKKTFPSACLMSDVALDPYTTHGHDGLINTEGEILNDATVEILAKMAVIQAQAGIDMVAPSDMMDGRVRVIRNALDASKFSHVNIHAYSAKYASSFYGPFREALSSSPKFGDKKTYQMNPANQREALREAKLDEEEGADILMVKPALPYLDVISKLKEETTVPISAYQVSGEYAMIMAASQNGWINGPQAFWESVLSIKRAGADMIITYAAPLIAEKLTTGAPD
jgi:porphobilinogen synthase